MSLGLHENTHYVRNCEIPGENSEGENIYIQTRTTEKERFVLGILIFMCELRIFMR